MKEFVLFESCMFKYYVSLEKKTYDGKLRCNLRILSLLNQNEKKNWWR